MALEHKDIPDAQRHEPKGASTAATGDGYVSDGAGSGTWQQVVTPAGAGNREVYVSDGAGSGSFSRPLRMGWWDYEDTATTTTPINIPNGSYIKLTNDGLGANSDSTYRLPEVPEIWDTGLNVLDFSDLALGDTVSIRIDTSVTTAGANDQITWKLRLGIGGSPYDLVFASEAFKTSGTYSRVHLIRLYMGDDNTRLNPAEFQVQSDSASDTMVVNGWFVEALSRGNF